MFSFSGHQVAYSPKKFPLGVTDKWDRNRILGLEFEEEEIQWQHLDGMWFTTDDIMTKSGHQEENCSSCKQLRNEAGGT